MSELLIRAPVPARAIPCTLLWRAMGQERYAAAQRVLDRNGWFCVIAEDAWVFGWAA